MQGGNKSAEKLGEEKAFFVIGGIFCGEVAAAANWSPGCRQPKREEGECEQTNERKTSASCTPVHRKLETECSAHYLSGLFYTSIMGQEQKIALTINA